MANERVLTNAKLWLAGYDMSGDVNAIALKYGAELKEATNFGSSGFRTRLPGVKSFDFAHEGFVTFGAGNVDEQIFSNAFAVANQLMSIAPGLANGTSGNEGDVCFTGQVEESQYSPGAKHGDVLAFSLSGESDGDELVRGTLMANRTVTSNANGPVVQLGAVASGRKVYAGLHVLPTVNGATPVCNVTVQSAPAANFASPSTRLSFSSANAAGAQWAASNGTAITDQFWRVAYTVAGANASFPIVATVGIK